jgi:addiction module HigA family antidote
MVNTITETRKLLVSAVGFAESRLWRFGKVTEDGQRWLIVQAPKKAEEATFSRVLDAISRHSGGAVVTVPAGRRTGPQIHFAIGASAATADRMAKILDRNIKLRGVPSPGDVLWREHFAPGGITYPIMADLTGVSLGHLHDVVNAKVKLSAKVDAKLSAALGTKPGYWTGLQEAFDNGKKKKK